MIGMILQPTALVKQPKVKMRKFQIGLKKTKSAVCIPMVHKLSKIKWARLDNPTLGITSVLFGLAT